MILTTKRLLDDLSRDLSPVEREYGEDLYDDGPWPTDEECADDLDHE